MRPKVLSRRRAAKKMRFWGFWSVLEKFEGSGAKKKFPKKCDFWGKRAKAGSRVQVTSIKAWQLPKLVKLGMGATNETPQLKTVEKFWVITKS